MKILLIDNSSINQIGNKLYIEPKTGMFALELRELGNKITLYGQRVESNNTVHVFHVPETKLEICGLKRRKNKILNYILLYIKILPEVLKSDFVYIFYPTSFKYVAIICIIFRRKYGLYIRGEIGLNDLLSHIIYKKAYTILTVTQYFTDFVNRIVGDQVAASIRPMIDFTEKDINFSRLFNNNETKKILYLSRLSEDKGISELIYAFKILLDKKHNLKLEVVGNGDFMDSLKLMVEDLKIENQVHIRGAVFEPHLIKYYYENSDLYILPTYHEGFPRTLYEAMIFGTPIITTLVGGIPAIMKNGFNCREIKAKSIASIVEEIEFAISNYSKMVEFAKNGFETVEKIINSQRLTHAQQLNNILNNK